MKFNIRLISLVWLLSISLGALAVGWPADFEGVMLQGFYWDSYKTETKWKKLERRSDELSPYFKLIWVPNSGRSTGGLGYMPIFWFSNHNSDMGTEVELRSMIATYKSKGTGILADVVINHRAGVRDYADFPKEHWDGKTWQIGLEGICSNDELANVQGQPKPTGAPDTGENFEGARDLDHTNANVQDNCKNYCRCLLEDFGYSGFRLDCTKGYSGQYTKLYNQYAKPTYSVGEFWMGGYDDLVNWIESTGRESAAFDFSFKYAVNEAFASGDLSKLVWMENGVNPQPAGLIHHEYQQLAVTFIDNHDTVRDHNKFNGNVLAANAFMICSPGTPCVFLKHWNDHAAKIGEMISARNEAGVTNTSKVRVLRHSSDCYMAEITGKRGKLAVRIGSGGTPEGYNASQVACSGDGYCIWVSNHSSEPKPDMTVYFDNSSTSWSKVLGYYWGGPEEATWPGVALTPESGNIWKLTVPGGSTGLIFNNGDKDGQVGTTQTVDLIPIDGHLYSIAGDLGKYGEPQPDPTYPDKLYLIGNLAVNNWWVTNKAVAGQQTAKGKYTWSNVTLEDANEGSAYFSFITVAGADWEEVNRHDRYGASTKDEALTAEATIQRYQAGAPAEQAASWCVKAGNYNIEADLTAMKVRISDPAGVADIEADASEAAVLYNLQGVRVDSPAAPGVYIERRGSAIRKVLVRP